MSDLELMRERLLEATLAHAEPDESLVQGILTRARENQGAPPAALAAAPVSSWPRALPWLEAACILAVVSFLAWRFVAVTGPQTPAETPGKTTDKQAPGNIEPLPGAQFEDGEPLMLKSGMFFVGTGAPSMRAGRQRIEMLGGRVLLKIGAAPTKADIEILDPWLHGHPQAANLEERKMLLNTGNWLVRGALALCVIAGAIEIDGEIVQAAPNKDPRVAEIDDYFVPTDFDKNGEISWAECLTRDRKARKVQPEGADEAQQRAWLARYQWRIDREEFLFADKNDDLKLTRDEWRQYLDAQANKNSNAPEEKLSAKDLASYCRANADDQWPSLLEDADSDKDRKLSAAELRRHFLFLDEDDEEEKQGFGASFAKADTNNDGKLDLAEYAEFTAAEHQRGQDYYAEYLIHIGGERAEKTQVPAVSAKKPNKVKVGTVWYVRVASPHELKGPSEDGTGATSWRYTKYTITSMSNLGFKAMGYGTDADLKKVDKEDETALAHTWDKGAEPASATIEIVKVGDVECECYVYDREFEPTVNGIKQPKVHECTWVLTTCPMIIIKRMVNERLVEETLKFEE